jgi:hypothetical protein
VSTAAAQRATVARAVDLIDIADQADLILWLRQAELHPEPAEFRRRIIAAAAAGYDRLPSSWRASLRLFKAAGLDHLAEGDARS